MSEPIKIETLTDEQADNLSSEQLTELETKGELQSPTPASPTENKQDTTQASTENKPAEVDKPEVVYAGTFKTPDDLINGVNELVKSLNVPSYLSAPLSRMIEEAKKTGDWKGVEETYEQLRADFTKQQQKEAEAKKAIEDKARETQKPVIDERKQAQEFVRLLYNEAQNHPIARKFASKGLKFPTTDDEMEELQETQPFLALEFKEALKEIANDVRGYQASMQESETAKTKAVTDGTTQLTNLNSTWGIGLKPEEITKIVTEALASQSPIVFEDRNGVLFPRENGIANYFKAVYFDDKSVNQIRLNAATEARKKYDTEQEELRKKAVNSIGTHPLGGQAQTEVKDIDPNDDAQIDTLQTPEAIEEYQRKIAAKK